MDLDSRAQASNRFQDWRNFDAEPELTDVLRAVLDLFVTLGYHGSSVRAIADHAGMTVPGLYYHHASKQDMLVALLKVSNEEIRLRIQAALEDAGTEPRLRFAAVVESIVLYQANRHQLAQLSREIQGLEEPYRSQHIEMRDAVKATLLTEVIAARALGDFQIEDPHEANRAVLVLSEGVADWFRPGGLRTPQEIASRYVHFARALVADKHLTPHAAQPGRT